MILKLEQTAVAAPQAGSFQPTKPGAIRPGVQLHALSIEHAAIVTQLDERRLDLILLLGRGLRDRDCARALGIPHQTIRNWLRSLMEDTRMTRLSLAVLGYQLAGQIDDADLKAAA